LTGIFMVLGLIALWALFLSVQLLLGGGLRNSKPAGLKKSGEQNNFAAPAGPDGFKLVFKRRRTFGLVADNEAALKEIEKKMLMVRKQYADGHMLQDIYVAETRRLYNVAKRLKP